MVVPAVIFVAVILTFWHESPFPVQESKPQWPGRAREQKRHNGSRCLCSLRLWSCAPGSRSAFLTYIPFHFIDYLKGDALQAGFLVSTFLAGGAIGTLAGAPLADRWGHKRYLVLSMLLSSLLMPLFFVTKGILLFVVLGLWA